MKSTINCDNVVTGVCVNSTGLWKSTNTGNIYLVYEYCPSIGNWYSIVVGLGHNPCGHAIGDKTYCHQPVYRKFDGSVTLSN